MKKPILIALWLILANTLLAQQNNSNPFNGFKTMALPRESVPIGALWNISLGPTGKGVNSEFLNISKSYNDYSQIAGKEFSTSLELGLLKYITANGNYSSTSKSEYKIENISIVTLNSPDVLKNSVGQYILYEAIKIKNVSVIVNKGKELEVKADLKKMFANLDITSETDIKNQKKLEIKGVDLYIAYRVVKIEKEKTSHQKLKFSSQGYSTSSSVKLSSNYAANTNNATVKVCPCSIQQCLAESSKSLSQCGFEKGYDFTIILKNRIDINSGTPEELKFKVYAGDDISNVNRSLYSIPTSEGLEICYLNIERMIFSPITRTLIYLLNDKAYRRAYVSTTKIKFENNVPNSVAGW